MIKNGNKAQVDVQKIYTALPLKQVVIPDVIGVFSYPRTGEILLESLQEYGIINPVVVTQYDGNDNRVVCGTKRVYAAKKLGWREIPVRILAGKPLTDREMFDLAFVDNTAVRKLNMIECAGVISAISNLYHKDEREKINKYLAQMELQSGAQSIYIYKSVYQLEDAIKAYLFQWNISAAHAAKLMLFEKQERQHLFHIIEMLNLHGGKFKQLIELVFEISKRDKKSVKEIFGGLEAGAILTNGKATSGQKQAKILDRLHARRYPQLTQRLREFRAIAASMQGFQAEALAPPHNFEGNKLRASFSFKSLDELDSFCAALSNKFNREKIQSLLNLL